MDGAGGDDSLAALPGDRCDGVEVSVVVEYGEVELLGCRGHQQIGDLAPTLAALASSRWT